MPSMIAFQAQRRDELKRWRAGDKSVEPPATAIRSIERKIDGKSVRVRYFLDPHRQRSLAQEESK